GLKNDRHRFWSVEPENNNEGPKGDRVAERDSIMNWIRSKRLLAGLTVAALGSAALALPVEAATLRMAWSQDATGLDPHKQTAFSSLRLLELIYEPLVRLSPSLDVVPAVAESWEFSDDGLTLTFHLDPDAKFSDGTQVTSEDVKAS